MRTIGTKSHSAHLWCVRSHGLLAADPEPGRSCLAPAGAVPPKPNGPLPHIYRVCCSLNQANFAVITTTSAKAAFGVSPTPDPDMRAEGPQPPGERIHGEKPSTAACLLVPVGPYQLAVACAFMNILD